MASANTAQRVPAWKRLGLALKQSGSSSASGAPASEPAYGTSASVGHPSGSTGHKRKGEAPPSSHGDSGSPLKKARRDDKSPSSTIQNAATPSSSKPKKSVKFGDTPSKNDVADKQQTPSTKTKPSTPKKSKGPAKKTKTPPTTDVKPALEYLRQWKTSRESWKFNKNHQSTLIKHIFDHNVIPTSDIDNLIEYLSDLKGFVRTRLRETAMEVQMQDAAAGSAGFGADVMDIDDKQETYDAILADIFRRKREQSGKRKYYNEAQFVSESQDGEVVIRRLVKRMRAELVIDELSDDSETTDSTSTTASSKTIVNSDTNATVTTGSEKGPEESPKKLAETTSRRRRKLRTMQDDSSSSESSSEEESDDSSSESSSDDSDSDEEDGQRDNEETSSSSSSSSSEGEDGDTDSDESDEEL